MTYVSFEAFVENLVREYEAEKAEYYATPEHLRVSWYCDTPIPPPEDQRSLTPAELKAWWEWKLETDAIREREAALEEERRFIHNTCFPLADYWKHKNGTVTVLVQKLARHRKTTTYMLQIAPACK